MGTYASGPSVQSKNSDRQSGFTPVRDAVEPGTGNKAQTTGVEYTITGPGMAQNGPGTSQTSPGDGVDRSGRDRPSRACPDDPRQRNRAGTEGRG